MELQEVKEWLRVDDDYDDEKINFLISASRGIIETATGLKFEDIVDSDILNVYKLTQKVIITNLYDTPEGKFMDNCLIGLYTQLETYRLGLKYEN